MIHTVKLKDRTSTKCPALNGLDLSISSLVLTAMKTLNEYMHKAAVVDNDSLRESYPITRSTFHGQILKEKEAERCLHCQKWYAFMTKFCIYLCD